MTLIVQGWSLPYENPLPWHATLFRKVKDSWNFVCGGTLIAERIVLTAGHCVWKSSPKAWKVSFKTSNFIPIHSCFEKWINFNFLFSQIVLASNSSNFDTQGEEVQIRDVEKIEIEETYNDFEGNYNSDLAVFILKERVTVSERTLPVCVDFRNEYDLSERAGEIGIAAGK